MSARIIGRRLRRGTTAALVSALVIAAVTASQGPAGGSGERLSAAGEGGAQPSPAADTAGGDSAYFTELPPLVSPQPPGVLLPEEGPSAAPQAPTGSRAAPASAVTGPAEGAQGIPASVLAAYLGAEKKVGQSDPGCGLRWQLLAAIGKVESGQARGGQVDAGGTTLRPILGPVLDGNGFANISDTDGGAYDGDSRYDRAVGPMQFIPSTWAAWGQDADGDGRRNPNNVHDAALAAARYLCAGTRDLRADADLDRAVLSYNRSTEYLRTVRSWFAYYLKGTHEIPDRAARARARSPPRRSRVRRRRRPRPRRHPRVRVRRRRLRRRTRSPHPHPRPPRLPRRTRSRSRRRLPRRTRHLRRHLRRRRRRHLRRAPPRPGRRLPCPRPRHRRPVLRRPRPPRSRPVRRPRPRRRSPRRPAPPADRSRPRHLTGRHPHHP